MWSTYLRWLPRFLQSCTTPINREVAVCSREVAKAGRRKKSDDAVVAGPLASPTTNRPPGGSWVRRNAPQKNEHRLGCDNKINGAGIWFHGGLLILICLGCLRFSQPAKLRFTLSLMGRGNVVGRRYSSGIWWFHQVAIYYQRQEHCRWQLANLDSSLFLPPTHRITLFKQATWTLLITTNVNTVEATSIPPFIKLWLTIYFLTQLLTHVSVVIPHWPQSRPCLSIHVSVRWQNLPTSVIMEVAFKCARTPSSGRCS